MTTSIPVEGSRIIAAMTPPTSKAPFNRGRLILRASDGTIVHAQTYTSEGAAEGPLLAEEELRRLIETEHATGIPAPALISAVPGTLLWVLRPNFPRRDRALSELRMSEILVHSPIVGWEDSRLCLVDERRVESLALRDRWRDEAMVAAERQADRGEWQRATLEAEFAHAVCRGLDADVLGFLSLGYERCGRTKRAEGLLVMARRSRSEDFEAQVIQAREHFERTLTIIRPGRARPRHGLAAALRRIPSAAPAVGRSQSSRLAA